MPRSTALFSLGHLKATTTSAVGKSAIEVAASTPSALGHASTAGMGVGAGLAFSPLGLVVFGGFGALSAITNQMEYNQERYEIRNFYREEIAAQNKVALDHVGDRELTKLEKGNNASGIKQNATISEALTRERKIRNLGISASFVASIAAFTLIETITHGIPVVGAVMAAKCALGILSYMAIKSPLVKFGMHVFGMNKDITHDKIVEIARDREKGHSITREQVVEVFISSSKQLQEYVLAAFGKEYDNLPLAQKVRVSNELANVLPIDKLVHSINLGTANASELAFTVQGDFSGVLPKTPDRSDVPASRLQKFAQKCRGMLQSVTHRFGAEKAHAFGPPEASPIHETKKPETMEVQPESPVAEFNQPSFAERLGHSPADHTKSHVQKLAEHNARQQVTMPGSNTIQ